MHGNVGWNERRGGIFLSNIVVMVVLHNGIRGLFERFVSRGLCGGGGE
jgi:hypothetical protein